MELLAVIYALEALPGLCSGAENEKIAVYTDSQYVQKGITIWIKDWKSRGWRKSDKEPVKNQDLWQRLDALAAGFSLSWVWIKGHAGNEFNERCDGLTQKAIASL
jgi:ribonuclease HI